MSNIMALRKCETGLTVDEMKKLLDLSSEQKTLVLDNKPLELIDIVQALEHLFLTNHCQKHITATYENPQTFDKFELSFRKI